MLYDGERAISAPWGHLHFTTSNLKVPLRENLHIVLEFTNNFLNYHEFSEAGDLNVLEIVLWNNLFRAFSFSKQHNFLLSINLWSYRIQD